eukprot:4384080-Amphidinium_carterae.1
MLLVGSEEGGNGSHVGVKVNIAFGVKVGGGRGKSLPEVERVRNPWGVTIAVGFTGWDEGSREVVVNL